jgi:DNA-binding beta-propeller fold protein YncE
MKRAVFALVLLTLTILGPLVAEEGLDTGNIQAQSALVTPSPTVPFERYRIGYFPRSMVFDGTLMWVANWFDNSVTLLLAVPQKVNEPEENKGRVVRVLQYDGTANSPVGRRPVALAWDGNFIWLANYDDNQIYVINPDPNNPGLETVVGSAEGVRAPVAMLFDSAHIWVVNQGSGTTPGYLLKIEARSRIVLSRCPVGRFPTAITWDGTRIWVANGLDNSVTILDAANCEEGAQTINVHSFPITVAHDGIHLWVGHYDGSILVINAGTLKPDAIVIDELPGNPPRPIQLMYAFEHVWVTNVHDGSFGIVRAINGEVVRQAIPVGGDFPATLGYTDDEIWIADWLNRTVFPFNPLSIWLEAPANSPDVITRTPGILLPTPTATATPTPTNTPTPCDADFPPRLVVGGRGIINREYGTLPLILRDNPGSTGTTRLNSYLPGTTFDVLDGPVCILGTAWFKVKVNADGLEGWFAETLRTQGGTQAYTVDPLSE